MKSQVSALLHVLRGLHKDVLAAYPEMMDDLIKDYERIARLSLDRGLGVFTLDLPHLESLLLRGLETGSLSLEGPLTERISKRIHVPRLYGGLWLLIFEANSSLKCEVDVTALAFLRQLLVVGKKLRVECSFDRREATVGAYHDIERHLRSPDLDWSGDELGIPRTKGGDDYRPLFGVPDNIQHDFFATSEEVAEASRQTYKGQGISKIRNQYSLHLVQALSFLPGHSSGSHPLLNGLDEPTEQPGDRALLSRIQQVADFVMRSWDTFDAVSLSAYYEECGKGTGFKHGPGAVAERLKNWEKTQFPNWPLKLQGTFPYEYCGTSAAGLFTGRPTSHEVASRLIAVPKTSKSPRLIAAEPTSHQWCQQLILRFMFDQCRKSFGTSFIDFHDQTKSGDLVLSASLDGSLATVDLSDASDRLSCWTVERMFRSSKSGALLHALHAARTRYLRDEVSEEKSFSSLKKFASQGTATTFPVMSLVMLFIALGVTFEEGERVTWHTIRKRRDQVRVFGDDIIIPAHGYERLVRAMALLQLKVNVAKSYVTGRFRESCGTDGFGGYDVTPLKPQTLVADSPASCQAVVDNANNLHLKGYWNASAACIELLPPRLRRGIRIVGPHDVGFRGVTSFTGSHESHLTTRWNSRLCRNEVRVWTLSVRTEEHQRNGLSALLDFFASKHSHEFARTVSKFADVRKTRVGLQWEPSNSDSGVSTPRGRARFEGASVGKHPAFVPQFRPIRHR